MQRENKWQDRWEDCGLKARITDVEMFAINHGFAEWKGQSIPEFIQSEIDLAVAEERERIAESVMFNITSNKNGEYINLGTLLSIINK
jgi:hypothetical protein